MIKNTAIKSDWVGSTATALCAVHCLATPFIFVAQSCSASKCCESSPFWWSAIDYIFIAITFLAVYQSSKNTSKSWMKYGLYASWIILTALVLNEKTGLLNLSAWWKYISAAVMIFLHMYNLKFCQCAGDSCCSTV